MSLQIKSYLKTSISMSLLCLALFSGCQEENEERLGILDNVLEGDSHMSAKIDGKTFESDLGAIYMNWQNKGVSVTSLGLDEKRITLIINSDDVGEYRVTGLSGFSISYEDKEEFYLATSGLISITKRTSSIIEGSFSATMVKDSEFAFGKTIKLESGKFKAVPADPSVK